jgi:hypothetical protein
VPIGSDHVTFIQAIFDQLKKQKPERPPPRGVLADTLRANIKNPAKGGPFTLMPAEAALFGSAAVEMWLRAVHSFLISNSMMKASPIWSSVAGYYSSHYVMRAFSHILGHFLLQRDHLTVQVKLDNGGYACVSKKNSPSEHQYYWGLPKSELGSSGSVLFSANQPMKDFKSDGTDGSHRVFANYFDHVNSFTNFETVNEDYLKVRIEHLSELVTDSPALPDHKKYPDLDSVHVIAYARIVKFRTCMDNVVGPKHKYWAYFRDPSWFMKYMDFQVLGGSAASTLSTIPE